MHLTGEELIPILRTQEAYNVPPVVIEVPQSRVLAAVDAVLPWALLASLALSMGVPMLNMGDAAILYCFVFLYLMVADPGAWSIDSLRSPEPVVNGTPRHM